MDSDEVKHVEPVIDTKQVNSNDIPINEQLEKMYSEPQYFLMHAKAYQPPNSNEYIDGFANDETKFITPEYLYLNTSRHKSGKRAILAYNECCKADILKLDPIKHNKSFCVPKFFKFKIITNKLAKHYIALLFDIDSKKLCDACDNNAVSNDFIEFLKQIMRNNDLYVKVINAAHSIVDDVRCCSCISMS